MLVLFHGPMKAGKTCALHRRLLQVADALRDHSRVTIIAPYRDTRERSSTDTGHALSTHASSGLGKSSRITGQSVRTLSEAKWSDYTHIGIDEGHMFGEELVSFVQQCLKTGRNVFVSGLKYDTRRRPIGMLDHIEGLASEVIPLRAICDWCASHRGIQVPANFSAYRDIEMARAVLAPDDKARFTIDVGGSEKYVALCASCYNSYDSQLNIDRDIE